MASITMSATRAVMQHQQGRASFRRAGPAGGKSSSTCRAVPLGGPRRLRVQQQCDSSSPRAQRRNSMMLDPYAFYRTPVSDLANRMLEEFVGCQQPMMVGGKQSPRNVPVDVLERETEYVVWAELPGCDEEDVTVQLDGRILTLSAGAPPTVADYLQEDSAEGEKANETVLMAERGQRAFSRAFRLPKDVDQSGIHATMEKGVLTLVMPRVLPEKPTVRTIPIAKGRNTEMKGSSDETAAKEIPSDETKEDSI
uniref:SHSP domain-containing protein n=1 Tax=Tetraselmis chuii TaxID=63592 RepID=A0A7S1X6C2_9CHLO